MAAATTTAHTFSAVATCMVAGVQLAGSPFGVTATDHEAACEAAEAKFAEQHGTAAGRTFHVFAKRDDAWRFMRQVDARR